MILGVDIGRFRVTATSATSLATSYFSVVLAGLELLRRMTRKVLICAKLFSVNPNPNSGSSTLEHAGGLKA